MLAAIEDLLDSWPGTLLVVSHDRYLLERVTDNQYAVMDAAFRHLPGGVEQYLQLRAAGLRGGGAADGSAATSQPAKDATAKPAAAKSALSGAELRNAQKEIAAIDRKLVKLADQIAQAHERLAGHDHSDYDGLGALTDELRALESQVAELETRWLELSELLGG
jgi:hypothetical protein